MSILPNPFCHVGGLVMFASRSANDGSSVYNIRTARQSTLVLSGMSSTGRRQKSDLGRSEWLVRCGENYAVAIAGSKARRVMFLQFHNVHKSPSIR